MSSHVEGQRDAMFKASADEVRNQLEDMVSSVEETLADKTDEVFMQIKRDYRAVLGGEDVPQGEVLPRVQRLVRKETKKTIDGVERLMKIAVGLEVEDLPDDVKDEDEVMESDHEDEDAADNVRGEKKELPASTPGNIKHEVADAAPPMIQPSTSITSEIDDHLQSGHTGVKHEKEEPQFMDVIDRDSGSDSADGSTAGEDDSDRASSDVDDAE